MSAAFWASFGAEAISVLTPPHVHYFCASNEEWQVRGRKGLAQYCCQASSKAGIWTQICLTLRRSSPLLPPRAVMKLAGHVKIRGLTCDWPLHQLHLQQRPGSRGDDDQGETEPADTVLWGGVRPQQWTGAPFPPGLRALP